MEKKSPHLILADGLSQVIVDFAKDRGISIKEARKIFISALEKYNPDKAEYDPEMDPSHPMRGWRS